MAFLLLGSISRAPAAPQSDWIPVVEGVDQREFVLPLPNRVFVTRMDLSNPNIILDTGVAQGSLEEGTETVAGMAARYEGALNTWGGGWGARNHVVAAINGSSFDLQTGVPFGGQIQSGWMIRRYMPLAGGSGLVWTADRKAFVGGCLEYRGPQQIIRNLETGETAEIDGFNTARDDEGIWVYTPHFASHTPEAAGDILVRVELMGPVGAVSRTNRDQGIVRELADGRQRLQIPFGYVVLAARGSSFSPYLRALRPGDRVGFSSDPIDLKIECEGRSGRSWRNAYASLGGGFVFLRGGEIWTSSDLGENSRDPRTAICLSKDWVYFVVVDGRQDNWSVGMTLGELALFCRDELDADWGLNQDGGGSSTMWVDGVVRNRPSDGHERGVGNSWLMIQVEPERRSRLLEEGFQALTQNAAEMRRGPGTLYEESSVLPAGVEVQIDPALDDVQGLFSGGTFWWRVSAGDQSGWIPQQALLSTGRSLAEFKITKTSPGD